jgi:hypothetical protein
MQMRSNEWLRLAWSARSPTTVAPRSLTTRVVVCVELIRLTQWQSERWSASHRGTRVCSVLIGVLERRHSFR